LNFTDDVYLAFLNQPHATRLLQILKTLFSLKRNGNNIAVSVEKAANVVKALKSYIYKNNTGDFEAADLPETINTVLILTANMIKHSKTVVTTKMESVPPVFCRQDELCQVWTNLITNAIQAMGEVGTLEISLKYDESREIIVARFKDSGPGIPDSIKSRIFEPYFTTKPKGMGTGMGLDISKQIIERHKGTIRFESEEGQGTTFIVEIPINQER
jgi:two-component system, NtrC family, sensor kinase